MTHRHKLRGTMLTTSFGAVLSGAVLFGAGAAHAQSCELKIGAMGPMSGGAAQWGLAMESAA